jgi:ABC-2 type transport system permease protein
VIEVLEKHKRKIDLRRIKYFVKRILLRVLFQVSNLPNYAKRLPYYCGLWVKMARNSFMVILAQKKLFFLFLTGKVLRFILFSVFLIFLVRGSSNLAGYSVNEAIFFFLTFNLVDVVSQFLYREVYRFRPLVVSGDLDLIMTKPFSTLFRVLMGGTDIIDLVTIPPLVITTIYVGSLLDPTFTGVLYYLLLLVNGLVISTAFHIAVLALGIITFEVDHVIWIYRDITNLGRFPIDIYRQPLKAVLTYFVPVGLMVGVPAKSFLGLVSFQGVVGSIVLGAFTLLLSIWFWNFGILKYQSASS